VTQQSEPNTILSYSKSIGYIIQIMATFYWPDSAERPVAYIHTYDPKLLVNKGCLIGFKDILTVDSSTK